jgi:hypothetical protein
MQILSSNPFDYLAFGLLCLAVVLRHNYLLKSLRKFEARHSDAPLAWSIVPVPKRDTNLHDGPESSDHAAVP